MNPSDVHIIDERISRWLYLNPTAEKLPHHIESLLYAQQRHEEAVRSKKLVIRPIESSIELKDALEEALLPYAERTEAEKMLADYIDEIVDVDDLKLHQLVDKMRRCRNSGVMGKTSDDRTVFVWDEKCSCSKLCPHESRDETQRLIRRYHSPIIDFINEKNSHRAFYSVFSYQNYKPGDLKEGKRDIIKRFNKWRGNHPEVKGALLIEEDPLSVHGDWNVHLNVILLVDGAFCYGQARTTWGNEYQLYITKLNQDNLTKTLIEAIKYSAQIVPSKSAAKASANATRAPAMIQWSHEQWIEWWKANKGFRRTRSYGVLYGIKDDEAGDELTDVTWLGEIEFSHDGRYFVSLILGDKSGRKYQRMSDLFDQYDQWDNYNVREGPP